MRVLLLSEGNTDIRLGPLELPRGAASVLVRRVLEEHLGRHLDEYEIAGGRLPRLHRGSGFRRKVVQAIRVSAHDPEVRAIVILIDRDGPENADRLRLLEQGREDAMQPAEGLASRTALGVAVEMIEAWLLADTSALADVLGVEGAVPDPEALRNPKSRLNSLIDRSSMSSNDVYDALAGGASLHIVAQRCRAFERFRREITERVPR